MTFFHFIREFADVYPIITGLIAVAWVLGALDLAILFFAPQEEHPCQRCAGEDGDKMTCRNACPAYQRWDLDAREWL